MSTIEISKKRQVNFLITVQTLDLLKKQVPNRKQSKFVEQTLVKALKKNAFKNALRNSFGAWKNHPKNTEKFVRSLRESKRI